MELVLLYIAANVAIGAAACFFGKRLFYIVLGILVFVGVFNVALTAGDGSPVAFGIAAVLGVGAALLSRFAYKAALLSRFAYKAGVFLIGAFAGAALGFLISMLLPGEASSYLLVIMLVAAVLVGCAALRWCDLFIRLGTAYAGATLVATNGLALLTKWVALADIAMPGYPAETFEELSAYISGPFSEANAQTLLIATIVLTIAGFIVQKKTAKDA